MADELPPGVKEVARVTGDNGGVWVLGSDGGVFALGGASYLGAYTDLEARGQGKQDPNRKFSKIYANGGRGYTLEDEKGFAYNFYPEAAIKPTAPTVDKAVQAPIDPNSLKTPPISGEAVINDALSRYGLQNIGASVLKDYRDSGSTEYAFLRMKDTDDYKRRFSGMDARQKAGYGPITEEQYVQWESAAKSLFDHYDLPKDFYDTPEELATFIAGDVDPTELKARVEQGYQAAFNAPVDQQQALQEMFGVGPGHLAAFFLDPTKGEEIINKQWTAAQLSAGAKKSGFGALTEAEAMRLAQQGLKGVEATSAFVGLEEQSELFNPGVGQQGDNITRDEQLAALGGDATVQQKIKKRAEQRVATFQGGGGFAGNQSGLTGLGEAD